ncbi:restriction endonuclease subunit S [Clostridium sulfidigenes]|uniref:restriction endonuclease subunit S n=1 Tax=Clostridium sulfidigenes TaxID=318464 RepID=UPI000690AB18|nr:restriction endonuclease subunit S [Clostridium sulfidigenes]
MRNIQEGYKKEKSRIIPIDWNFVKIYSILEKVGKKVDVKNYESYQQIGIRSHGKGLFYKESVTGEQLGNKSVFWIEKDCFIANIVFAWEQAIGRTTENEVGMICSHRFPMYRPIDNKIDVDYLVYLFKTPYGKKVLELASPGGAGRNKTLGQKEFINSEILIPDSIEEQKKIVKILSTWELAIKSQEQLIEKKKEFKKGLMQKLLSGEVRFKEFKDKWNDVTLNEVANCLDNRRVPINGEQRNGIKGDIPYYGATGIVDYINKFIFDEEIILVSEDGGYFYEYKDKPIAFYINHECWVNNHAHVLKNKKNINAKYLYYSLIHKNIIKYLNGGTRSKLNQKDLMMINIKLPSINEQTKISSTIESYDKEIDLLQKELEALKIQKKGLMQRLLTGEVRV